jgi:hypothetical protein
MQSPQIYLYAFTALSIIGLVVAVVYAGKDMVTAFDKLEANLTSAADQAAQELAQLSTYIGTGFQAVWDAIEYATNILAEYLSTSAAIAGKALEDAFGSFFRAASGWLQSALVSVIDAVNSAARLVADKLKLWLQSVSSAVTTLSKAMLREVVKTIRPITSELCSLLHDVVNTFYELFSNFEKFFTDKILPLLEEALHWIRDLFDSIGNKIEEAFDTVKNFFENLFNEVIQPIEDFIEDIAKAFISGSCSFFRELNNASQHIDDVIGLNLFPCSTIHNALYGTNNEYCTLAEMCDVRTYTPAVTVHWVDDNDPMDYVDLPHSTTPIMVPLHLILNDGSWSNGLRCSFANMPADGPGGTYQLATGTFHVDLYLFDEGTGGTTMPMAKWTVANLPTNGSQGVLNFGGYLPAVPGNQSISITAEFKTTTLEFNGTYRFQTFTTAGVVQDSESVDGYDQPIIGDRWRITWPTLMGAETFRLLTITHIGPMDNYTNSTFSQPFFQRYQIIVHEQTVDPTPADGNDGDYWLNTTSQTCFGPKTSGAWPAGVSLGTYGVEFPLDTAGFAPLVYNDYYTFGIRAYYGTSPIDPPMAHLGNVWVSEILQIQSFIQVTNFASGDTVYVPYATIDVETQFVTPFNVQVELLPLPSGTPIMLIPIASISTSSDQIQWPVNTPEGNYDIKISDLSSSYYYIINNITITHKLQVISPTTAPQYLAYPVAIQWSDWNATLAVPTVDTHVDIDLYHPVHGVTSVATAVLTTYGTNTLNWTLPITVTPDVDYQIRVTSVEFPSMVRYSALFPVENPIVVTSPAPSTNFYANDTLPVTWTYPIASDAAALKIVIQSVNSVQHAYVVTSSTDNDGLYIWAIPSDVIHDDYQVQVQHVSKGLTAVSGAITINENNPMVFVQDIAAIQYLGQDLKLNWRYDTGGMVAYTAVSVREGPDYSVVVPGYSDIFPGIINDDTTNGNQHTWTVPFDFPLGTNYRIAIHAPGLSLTTPVFEVAQPIALVTPAAGAVIQKDTSIDLTWTYENGGVTNIQIDLINDVNTYTLSASEANTGSETTVTVNIPSSVVVPAAYHIQLTDLTTGVVYQSEPMSVVTPITVSLPVAAQQHTRNTNLTVEWSYSNAANMKVELFNATNTYTLLDSITNVQPTTNTAINIPNTVQLGDYQIRVTDLGLTSFSVSDTFTILSPIEVTVPAAGAVQQYNTNMTITWTYDGGVNTSNMSVELINSNNTYTLIANTLNDGASTTRIALVPNTVLVPATYQVRVTDTDVNYLNVSGPITVTYQLTISQPISSLVQQRGTNMTVTWNYGGNENMTISLRNTDNIHSYVLQSVTPNVSPTKTMSLYVPNAVVAGSYQVRVASMTFAGLYVDSDVFTVTV